MLCKLRFIVKLNFINRSKPRSGISCDVVNIALKQMRLSTKTRVATGWAVQEGASRWPKVRTKSVRGQVEAQVAGKERL